MAKGSAFLLKALDNDASNYRTIAGLRVSHFGINGEAVEAPSDKYGWRDLIAGAGVRSVSISASGIFLGSASEALARNYALSGSVDSYELSFEDGTRLRGQFLIMRLDYAGDFNGERNYTLQLESSGEVSPQ